MASGMAWRDEIEGGSFTKIADELDRIYAYINANEFSSIKPFLAQTDTTTPLGTWIDAPYSAANFSVSLGGGTWTVTSASQVTYTYLVIGKAAWINVQLLGTVIAGVVNEVRIRLPKSLIYNKAWGVWPVLVGDGATNGYIARALIGQSGTGLQIARTTPTLYTAYPVGSLDLNVNAVLALQ